MECGAQRPAFGPFLGLDVDAKTFLNGSVYSFDTAAAYDEYQADVCRVVVVGRATQHQKDMCEAAFKINDAVRAASRAGAKTRELWDVCDDTIKELGVHRPSEPDRIGHGFGLSGNEPPSIGPHSPEVLVTGNIHCIEPGIGDSSGYYYIEENVWVTQSGNDMLTDDVSRDLWEITN